MKNSEYMIDLIDESMPYEYEKHSRWVEDVPVKAGWSEINGWLSWEGVD